MAELLSTTSIVPIAGALAKKLGLSLPGNDAVKEAGALLAFEAIKSATEVLFPTVAAGMRFNASGFTLAIFQKKLDDISDAVMQNCVASVTNDISDELYDEYGDRIEEEEGLVRDFLIDGRHTLI